MEEEFRLSFKTNHLTPEQYDAIIQIIQDSFDQIAEEIVKVYTH